MRRERNPREREGPRRESEGEGNPRREKERIQVGERDPGGERERVFQERETRKGAAAPPSPCSRTGGFGPLAGTAAGRRRSAGGAVAQGWPPATPQRN